MSTDLPPASGRSERPASRWRRFLSTAVTIAAVLALILLGYSCVRPNARSSYSAPVQQLLANGVTYVANGSLYVVAQPDGTLAALDERDRQTSHRLDGCVVRYLPGVDAGVFMEDARCGGARYNLDGSPQTGGPPLLRHSIRLAGKQAVVDIRHCTAPESGVAMSCKQF